MIEDRRSDLHHYWRALLRQKWLVALTTLALSAGGLAFSLSQDKVYRATSQLLIDTETERSLFDPATGRSDTSRELQTQIGVLTSPAVRDAVLRELPGAPVVSAAAIGQTDIVLVSAESTDPRLASRTTDAHARAYIDYRRRQSVDGLLAAGREIQVKIDALKAEIADVEGQLAAAKATNDEVLSDSLGGRRDSLITQQALFRQRLDEVQVDAGLQSAAAQLVGPAKVPTEPIRPKPVRSTVFLTLMGLVAGVAIALLRDRLDESLKTRGDLERAVPGLPVLAVVPKAPETKGRGRPAAITASDPSSPAAEAYRTLRTAIRFMSVDREIGVIQLTSPDAAEGKSTTLANLAVAMARNGQRVLVVGCDLRRPTIQDFFGLDNTRGFTSVLLNEVTLPEALQVVESEPNIVVLAAGPPAPNPAELLSSPAAARVLKQLRLKSICDVVLVDCPPVLPVTDAVIISAHVDATVLVAAAGETTEPRLREAVDLLRQVDAPLIGIVLNGVRSQDVYAGGYAYEDGA